LGGSLQASFTAPGRSWEEDTWAALCGDRSGGKGEMIADLSPWPRPITYLSIFARRPVGSGLRVSRKENAIKCNSDVIFGYSRAI
jgi:hypothetical protein